MVLEKYSELFEALYRRYNRRTYVQGDPLRFVYHYDNLKDREVGGIIASLLAYGRVEQIQRSVETVLNCMGDCPNHFLRDTRPGMVQEMFSGFVHRIWTSRELVPLLLGLRRIVRKYGSIGAFFRYRNNGDPSILPVLQAFVDEVDLVAKGACRSLLPSPQRGSACKRLHLYLRWMVRFDRVDPGGWDWISPAVLMVPLDAHMYRIGRSLGAIRLKSANARAAEQITAAFKTVCPEDPAKYDFALTRLGMSRRAGEGDSLSHLLGFADRDA